MSQDSGLTQVHGTRRPPPPKLLDRVRHACRVRHDSIRTEEAYHDWCRRFILFHGKRHPDTMAEAEVNTYLTHLAVEGHVAASTPNQALSALLFLYEHVLNRPLDRLGGVVRAERPRRLPAILSRAEVQRVFGHLEGTPRLMALLLDGAGLRVTECLSLRVHDLDFDRHEILVRHGKGGKDRRTMLPAATAGPLRAHLERVKGLADGDRAAGVPGVYLPDAIGRKYPRAGEAWGWQWVFPTAARPHERRDHDDLHARVEPRGPGCAKPGRPAAGRDGGGRIVSVTRLECAPGRTIV